MQIERLRLVVRAEEAAAWVAAALAGREDLSGLRLTFEPARAVFEGSVRVPLVGKVPFRTAWSLELADGERVTARLAQASAFGWGGGSGFFAGLILDKIRALVADREGFEVSGDGVTVRPAALLAGLPVEFRFRLTGVALEPGRLVLEAG